MELVINILLFSGAVAAAIFLYAVVIGAIRSGKVGLDGRTAPYSVIRHKISFYGIVIGYLIIASFFLCMAVFFASKF